MQEEEYRAAVQRYRDMVWRVALNACRQTQDAEDVVQDVFLKLYTTRREFDGEEHLKHWLLRVTVNRCRTLLACPWRTRRADAVPDGPRLTVESAPSPEELLRQMDELMKGFPRNGKEEEGR